MAAVTTGIAQMLQIAQAENVALTYNDKGDPITTYDITVPNGVVALPSSNVGFLNVSIPCWVYPAQNIVGAITSGSDTVTYAGADSKMLGATVTGTGIPTGTTIDAVTAGVSFSLSANASATNSSAALAIGEMVVDAPSSFDPTVSIQRRIFQIPLYRTV